VEEPVYYNWLQPVEIGILSKRLHPDTWTVTHHNEDAQTLTIRIEGLQSTPPRTIQIHNIYNPSPGSYTSTSEGTLGTLRKALEAAEPETEHIIIGDFNLHHPYWSSIERLTQHAAADILLEVTNVYDLELDSAWNHYVASAGNTEYYRFSISITLTRE
jgi:hypothetical protein